MKTPTWAQAGWALLSVLLIGFAYFVLLPAPLSEMNGVMWPGGVQAVLAAVAMALGLGASRRTGPLQWIVFAAAGLLLLVNVFTLRDILEMGGLTIRP